LEYRKATDFCVLNLYADTLLKVLIISLEFGIYIYVYNCYFFLLDCSIYQYEVTFFVSSNFGLNSSLSGMSIATLLVFRLHCLDLAMCLLKIKIKNRDCRWRNTEKKNKRDNYFNSK
jgi:hypothetical protein